MAAATCIQISVQKTGCRKFVHLFVRIGDQGEVSPPEPVKPSPKTHGEPSSASEDHDIMMVADLMLSAKKRIAKTKETVKKDIRLLKEWTGNKSDITAYSKKDLIDFVQNCLP